MANGPTDIELDGALKPLLWRKLRGDLVEARKHILKQELDARTLLRALKFRRKRCLHRSAAFVSEHHEQLCLKVCARVLEAAPDLRRHNIPRYTNDEQVAEFRIENQLRRHPRVAATENGCKRVLAFDEIGEYLPRRLRIARLTRKKRALPSIRRESASSAPTEQSSSLGLTIVVQSILLFQHHGPLVGAETGFVVAI